MKHLLTGTLMAALLLTSCSGTKTQTSSSKDQDFEQVVALIESGNYEFSIQSVNPAGRQTIRPTTIYTMVSKDGKLRAQLPYFGRAFQPSYGGDGGIDFDGEPEEFTITVNEKKRVLTMTCIMRGENERFNLTMTAGSTSYGTLSITTSRRQAISYYGLFSPLK
jgi:hypothetical protein